ncbi:hypothetical protein GS448_16000 [Rhodococcus hoagii]|nr:hypothetical protein [Prescottella equi]MBM4668551.1 hypothetical protein [Prescottella equi]NKV88718.1 hypothetical protein [Prescottella equi]
MISRTVKTLAASLLVAGGVVGAQAAVAHAEIRTAPDGTQTTVCVYDGKDYSVGSKVYHPDGTYQTCKSDGTWQRVKPNTGKRHAGRPRPAPLGDVVQSETIRPTAVHCGGPDRECCS